MAPRLLLRPVGDIEPLDIRSCQDPRVKQACHIGHGWEFPLQKGRVDVRVVLRALLVSTRTGPANL